MSTEKVEREPTADEAAGIRWWNALSEECRAFWLRKAGSAVAADAWQAFKQHQAAQPKAEGC